MRLLRYLGGIEAVVKSGILLGGGAFAPLLGRDISQRPGLDVQAASDPLYSVVKGARCLLRNDHGEERLTHVRPASLTVNDRVGRGMS